MKIFHPMSANIKRVLLVAALLAATVLIAFGLYLAFKKTTVEKPGEELGPGGGGELPFSGEKGEAPVTGEAPSGEVGITPAGPSGLGQNLTPSYYKPKPVEKVSSDYSIFTSLNNNGALRYHNGSDGKFYRISAQGDVRAMTDQIFYNVQEVTWAKNADKAILEYPDGTKTLYNFDTNKQVTLPKHWEDFSFSPDSSQISAKSLGLAPENRWLVTSNDDGSGTRLIEPLGENADKVIMDWSPSRQTVALSMTGQPVGADRREILFLGLNGENFKSTIVEGLNFASQWSSTGKKLLYNVDSARSNFKPELWIVNSYGEEIGSGRRMLELNTWAKKCSFASDDILYCAVPRELPEGAGMAPEIAAEIPDDLYKIDLKTGLRTSIALDKDYTFDSISYEPTTNKVYFSDHHETGIFEVKL